MKSMPRSAIRAVTTSANDQSGTATRIACSSRAMRSCAWGIYQFVLVAAILSASGITGMVVILLTRQRTFSAAAQLMLRGDKR
jgi:hypothetical protein